MPKEGDWMCPNCKVNIFRSKNECIKCKARKPVLTEPDVYHSPSNRIYDQSTQELYKQIDLERQIKRNELIQKAIAEGKPKLYYASSCSKCRSENDPLQHNCWKYS